MKNKEILKGKIRVSKYLSVVLAMSLVLTMNSSIPTIASFAVQGDLAKKSNDIDNLVSEIDSKKKRLSCFLKKSETLISNALENFKEEFEDYESLEIDENKIKVFNKKYVKDLIFLLNNEFKEVKLLTLSDKGEDIESVKKFEKLKEEIKKIEEINKKISSNIDNVCIEILEEIKNLIFKTIELAEKQISLIEKDPNNNSQEQQQLKQKNNENILKIKKLINDLPDFAKNFAKNFLEKISTTIETIEAMKNNIFFSTIDIKRILSYNKKMLEECNVEIDILHDILLIKNDYSKFFSKIIETLTEIIGAGNKESSYLLALKNKLEGLKGEYSSFNKNNLDSNKNGNKGNFNFLGGSGGNEKKSSKKIPGTAVNSENKGIFISSLFVGVLGLFFSRLCFKKRKRCS
ncbi:MAG: hypothetical protein LBT82_02320 [Oscillospiraceae bacterium]|jgi:hypothetical protein|nr:hypothetical protein [Oscillospiraceae bacterium]